MYSRVQRSLQLCIMDREVKHEISAYADGHITEERAEAPHAKMHRNLCFARNATIVHSAGTLRVGEHLEIFPTCTADEKFVFDQGVVAV